MDAAGSGEQRTENGHMKVYAIEIINNNKKFIYLSNEKPSPILKS